MAPDGITTQPNEMYKLAAKASQDTELYLLYQTELEVVAYNTLHPVRGKVLTVVVVRTPVQQD